MATEQTTLILKLKAELDTYNRQVAKAMKETQIGSQKGAKGLKDVEDKATSLNKIGGAALLKFAGIAAAAFSVVKIQQYADEYTRLQNRIRTVIDPTQDLGEVTKQLLDLSNETRTSLSSTSILYSRLKRNTDDLNLSNEDLIDLTRTINQSFAVSGATAEEASNAMVQLSQGLAAGALRGDEFNSVAEQAPVILEAVAAATGKSKGELRELAAEGKISAEVLVKSLQAYSNVIENDFAKANITAEQAQERLNNNFTVFVGELDAVIGLTESSVSSFEFMADAIEDLQQPLIDSINFIKDLASVISDDLAGTGEDFSQLVSDFSQELAFMEELLGAFGFALKTGLLAIPVVIEAAMETSFSAASVMINNIRIDILKFRRFLLEPIEGPTLKASTGFENLSSDVIADLDAQVAALEGAAEGGKRANLNIIDRAKINILEFRRFIAELAVAEQEAKTIEASLQRRSTSEPQNSAAIEALDAQIAALEQTAEGSEATLEAVIARVEERLAGLATSAQDFDDKINQARIERLTEQDEKELALLKERLEREQAIKAEFAELGGTVLLDTSLEDKKKSEKEITKLERQEAKARRDIQKQSANFRKSLLSGVLGDSKGAALAQLVIEQGIGAASVFINTQRAASLAVATLPPPLGEAKAAQLIATGSAQIAAIASTTLAGAAGIAVSGGGGGGGGGGISTTAFDTTDLVAAGETAGITASITTEEGVFRPNIIFEASPGSGLDTLFDLFNEWIRVGKIKVKG